MLHERLEQLFEATKRANHILILPHNNPDPDAIASAVALRYLLKDGLGIEGQIAYQGIIGRAENKALTRYLGAPLRRLSSTDLASNPAIALVDTQPGAGNNALPAQTDVAIIIDHHPWRDQARNGKANFVDIRPNVGSTASIMTEYLRLADLEIDPPLATALFYGIKTDTMGLGRGTSSTDMTAICYLLPEIDLGALLRIERAQVPPGYFKSFATTLQAARIYDDVVISYIGNMEYPDLAAEMADFLLRMQGVRWIICMGVHKDRLMLSVRTHNRRGAGELVQNIIEKRGVAGGHGSMAGGQVTLDGAEPEPMAKAFSRRALELLEIAPDMEGASLT
jgi:nanoRNase/pAp phosphatase (c-di-AMP/oligoRNAs hydrolase)